jgi:alcohol dehydrogenase (cytochrome c)
VSEPSSEGETATASVTDLPGDNWNLDHVFERILVDTEVPGKGQRKVLLTIGKTGIVWALDRQSGKFL